MLVLIGILCIVCLYDYTRHRIPNPLILLILTVGLMRSASAEMLYGVGEYFIASAVVIFLLYPLFRIGGLGAGDVKLMGVCAGFFPAEEVLYFLFISLLFSAIFSIVKLLKKRDVRDRVSCLLRYCREVARQRKWIYYQPLKNGQKLEGVCMAGPVLCSVLLKLGGVY